MANGSLARRYAKALVALGQESGNVEQIVRDLDHFSSILDGGDAELRVALSNPGLTSTERAAVIGEVLAKIEVCDTTANFLRLLVDKNRFGAFDLIQRAIHDMADEIAGRVRATVTTATDLSKEMVATVQAALEEATGKTVVIDFQTDKAVIGGMVAQVGDISYDASVAARLRALQQALIRNPGMAAAEA